jgi:hypothetical protein
MNVFNHRSLEAPVSHLLEQSPGLGVLDRKTLTLYLSEGKRNDSKLDELAARYEDFYQQREVSVSVPEVTTRGSEVLARIKKLNYPEEGNHSKW